MTDPVAVPVRVLFVEDLDSDAAIVARVLRKANPNVELERVDSAATFQSALARGGWDAVISDWAVPGFGAMHALGMLKASGLDLPFIVVSGTIGEELAVEAMRAGAHDYVLKDKLTRLAPALEREIRESQLRAVHRREQSRFRALIERSVEPVLLTTRAGIITYASPAAAYTFGLAIEELTGAKFTSLLHPEDRERTSATLKRVLNRDHTASPIDTRVLRHDNDVRFLSLVATNLLDDPEVASIVLNIRDVTERRRTSEALRASETRFARIAESGLIGVLTAEVTGEIIDANEVYARMLGYTVAELRTRKLTWHDILPADQGEAWQRAGRELEMLGHATPYETVIARKDGVRTPVLVGVAMLDYPMCVGFAVDLTERKRTEEALRKSEDHLRQAQKMEAVGRLAGGVAHDFNNVLSVILSYSEMLLDDLEPGNRMRDDISEIHKAGHRAADLTRQLLAFSRQQVLAPSILFLDKIVANMDKMLRRVVGEDIELHTQCQPVCTIRVDATSIEQVIMNLVVNARDAMTTGGQLWIETRNAELDAAQAAQLGGKPGPHVRLTVRDTGSGMDAATQSRMFEPFFTTKDKDKGTGLGLATVFGIVQQSGGVIAVTSEPGQGTAFDIYIPCVAGQVPAETRDPHVRPSGTETILLVEDEVQVRSVANGILKRLGYTVLDASGPRAALLLCAEYHGEIDLLLTDVVMPEMSGPELAKRLAALRPTMKVLFMSGYTDDSVVRHGVSTAGLAFLQKPFTPEVLSRKIRDALDHPPDANRSA